MKMKKWAEWLVVRRLDFVLYFIWLVILPIYWFRYMPEAMDDAVDELEEIKGAIDDYRK